MMNHKGDENMYNKILLPVDGSEYSEEAISHAYHMAKVDNSEIIILNVVDNNHLISLPEDTLDEAVVIMDEQGKEIVNHALKTIKELDKNSEIKITTKTVEGNPTAAILKMAEKEKVGIIIMASSGKHTIDRFLLGSVTEKTVRHSKIPVLVVPTNSRK